MSRRAARVTAHAKVNLMLRVLAREEHGFHSIETLFLRVALGDEVTVSLRDSGASLESRGADTGPADANLALRAARAFQADCAWPPGFAITIEKRVPVGGGLGGGSADAGAVLRALAALAPHPVAPERLLRMARGLGSDVPFLTTSAPCALAWGRGERMLALSPPPSRAVVLAMPHFAVATADAYRWLDDSRGGAADEACALDPARLASWDSLAALAANDFEPVVAARHPTIAHLLGALRRSGATLALLAGSGSTVFGIFPAPPDGDAFAALPATIAATHTLVEVAPVAVLE